MNSLESSTFVTWLIRQKKEKTINPTNKAADAGRERARKREHDKRIEQGKKKKSYTDKKNEREQTNQKERNKRLKALS